MDVEREMDWGRVIGCRETREKRTYDDTGVILEVEEDTVSSPPGLSLSDNDGGHDCWNENETRGSA